MKYRTVFTVYRQNGHAVLLCKRHDQMSGSNKRFFIGKRDCFALLDRRNRRSDTDHADNRGHQNLRFLRRRQSMNGENKERISKIILTASGGPFRGKKREDLAKMTIEDALKHPNWSMGKKVTIDSASLVNKGLEVMEAGWLFDVPLEKIQVVVHPQSIVHSAVEYEDGAIMAQLGVPDMKLPIQYALFYPDRRPMPGKRVDLFALGQLTFERPDTDTFRGLALAYEAAKTGGSMPTVYNAANEKAVALFVERKIGFLQIPELIERCMGNHKVIKNPSVEEILHAEAETYELIEQVMM